MDQGAYDGDPLLPSAGKAIDLVIVVLSQPDVLGQLVYPLPAVLLRHLLVEGMGHHVLPDREVLVQGDVLLDDADGGLGLPRLLHDVVPVYDDGTLVEPGKGAQDPHGGGLPCSVGAQEGIHLPSLHSHVNAVDG